MYFNIETIVRGYLTYQSMWVAVGKNCHAKGSKLTRPKALFCHCIDGEKFLWFAQCLHNKIGQSFVELLDPQLEDDPPGVLNSLGLERIAVPDLLDGTSNS